MAKVTDVVIVCAMVLVLDVAAGILGITQAARNQQVNNCDVAQGHGMAAVVLFVVAHLSSNIGGDCDYLCPKMKEIRASMSKWAFLVNWISAAVCLVGDLLLAVGTRWCKFRHGHAVAIGAIAAILCFVHGGIIIAFYMPAVVRDCQEAPQQQP